MKAFLILQHLLIAFAAAQCPSTEPSCVYQSAVFSSSDASKLWNTTSMTSSVLYVVVYYEQNLVLNACEITSYVVGTNNGANEFKIATSKNSSNSMSTNVSFSGALTQVSASYVTVGSSTSLRQLIFTVSGTNIQIIPPSLQQLSGVTIVTMPITGEFVGLYADRKTNALYIKTRYSVTLTPAIVPNMTYVLGTTSSSNSINFAGSCPVSAIVIAPVSNPTYLTSTLSSSTQIVLSVPYLANTTANQFLAGQYDQQLYYFCDSVLVNISAKFTVTIQLPECLTSIISIPNGFSGTMFQQYVYNTPQNQSFTAVSDSYIPSRCGSYEYSVNKNYTDNAGASIVFQNKSLPTFMFYSNNLNLANKTYTFQILANFFANPPYINFAQSSIMSIQWLDPCSLPNNTILAQTISDMATTVLVPINSTYTGYTTYLGNLTNNTNCCGGWTYNIVVSPSTLAGSDIYLNVSTNSSKFNISLQPLTNAVQGSYTAYIIGYLTNYPTVSAQSTNFTITVGYCLVTSLTLSIASTFSTYTLTHPQQANVLTVVQTPACQYAVNLQIQTTTGPSSLLAIDNITPQILIGVYSDLTIFQTNPTPIVTQIIGVITDSRNLGVSTTNFVTNTLTLVDPCLTTVIQPNPISIVMYSLNISQTYTFTDFIDTVSISQNNLTYCSARVYSLVDSSDPYTLTLDATTKTLTYASSSLTDANTYTRILKVSLASYATVVYNQSLTIVVLNPCWQSQLVVPSIANFAAIVLQPYTNYTFSQFNDSMSLHYNLNGSGYDICGPRVYSVTFSTINGGALTSSNCYVPTPTTSPLISAGSVLQTQMGNYSVVITAKLQNYTNVTVNSSPISLEILPCRVDQFTINQTEYSQYVLNYQPTGQPAISQIINLATTQVPNCNYTPQIIATINSTTASIVQVVSNQTAQITVQTTLRSQVGQYSIALQYNLTDYPISYHGSILQSSSFVINILDPCVYCQIIPQKIRDLVSFSGYSDSINGQIDLPSFLNDPNYVQGTIWGVYFYDLVSQSLGKYDFCGTKDFNFTGNYTSSEVQITGGNGKNLTYKASSSQSVAKSFEIDLNVSMSDNSSCYYDALFIAQNVVINPLNISTQFYSISQQQVTIQVGPFQYLSSNNRTSMPKDATYVAYQYLPGTKLQPPVDCASLAQKQALVDLPDFFSFNQSSYELSFYTNQSKNVGSYSIVICVYLTNNNNIKLSYASQFTLQVSQYLPFAIAITNQLPAVSAKQQLIPNCQNSQHEWQYVIPEVQDSQGYSVTTTVNLGTLSNYISYISQNRTLILQKSAYGISNSIQTIEISFRNTLGMKAGYTLQLIFSCIENFLPQTKQQNVLESLSKQKQFPQPTISSVTNNAVVNVQFSAPMNASKEELVQILNGTFLVDNEYKDIFQISLSNPQGLLNNQTEILNYKVLSYSSQGIQLLVNFSNSTKISNYQIRDNIKIKIVAFWLFHDQQGNYVKTGTITNQKSIPPQLDQDSAMAIAKLAAQTTSSMGSFMGGNALIQLFLGGSIQQMLEALRTIQITSHIMLIEIATPASASIFFAQLLNLVTMDLFPSITNWISVKLNFDQTTGISETFTQNGYQSLYTFQNYGSATLIIFILPVLLLLAKLIKLLKSDVIDEISDLFQKRMCWNAIIGYLFEMYLVMTICGLMNLYYIRFDSAANIMSFFLAISFVCVSVCLPIFYGYFYFKNFEAFKNGDKQYIEKYGTLVRELNLFRKGKTALVYPLIIMGRKLILVGFILVFIDKPLFSVIIINFSSLATGIALGWIYPHKSDISNNMELLNEFFVLITNYHMFCFTDFNNPQGKVFMGTSLVYITIINFLVAILVICLKSLINLKNFCRKRWVENKTKEARDHNTQIRMKNAIREHRQLLRDKHMQDKRQRKKDEVEAQKRRIAEEEQISREIDRQLRILAKTKPFKSSFNLNQRQVQNYVDQSNYQNFQNQVSWLNSLDLPTIEEESIFQNQQQPIQAARLEDVLDLDLAELFDRFGSQPSRKTYHKELPQRNQQIAHQNIRIRDDQEFVAKTKFFSNTPGDYTSFNTFQKIDNSRQSLKYELEMDNLQEEVVKEIPDKDLLLNIPDYLLVRPDQNQQ